MWLLTVIAIMSGISAFAQSFNAIHQLWLNLHNIRQFCSKKLGRTHYLSRNTFHPRAGFREPEDSFINIPTTMITTTGRVTHGKPEGSLSDRLDSARVHTKMSAEVIGKDNVHRCLESLGKPVSRLSTSTENDFMGVRTPKHAPMRIQIRVPAPREPPPHTKYLDDARQSNSRRPHQLAHTSCYLALGNIIFQKSTRESHSLDYEVDSRVLFVN